MLDGCVGAEGYNVPDVVCDIYFAGVRPCLGGLLAVDGRTGRQLWRHYSAHEVFAVNCNRDLDADSVNDCIVAGRVGVRSCHYASVVLLNVNDIHDYSQLTFMWNSTGADVRGGERQDG